MIDAKLRQEMHDEAVWRLDKMGIFTPVFVDFRDDYIVQISEPPLGACYFLEDEQARLVKEFEDTYNSMVYHVIRSFTEFGELLTLLHISSDKEDWPMDREGLDYVNSIEPGHIFTVFAYVINIDTPYFSEFGTVGVRLSVAGGLERIA